MLAGIEGIDWTEPDTYQYNFCSSLLLQYSPSHFRIILLMLSFHKFSAVKSETSCADMTVKAVDRKY